MRYVPNLLLWGRISVTVAHEDVLVAVGGRAL
jgi:hypothetical protein